MSRNGDFNPQSNLIDRIGRTKTRLSINDVADVVGDALKDQRRQIIQHVVRMFRLQELKAGPAQGEVRFRNLCRRLAQVESEIRSLKKGGSR